MNHIINILHMQFNLFGVILFFIGIFFTIFFLSKKDFDKALGRLSGIASIIGLIIAIVGPQVTDSKPKNQSYDTIRQFDSQPVTSPISQNTTQNISQNTAQNISHNTTQSFSQNTAQNISQNTAQSISHNTTQSFSQNTSQNISQNTAQSISHNTTQSFSQNTSQNISQNTSQNISNNNVVIVIGDNNFVENNNTQYSAHNLQSATQSTNQNEEIIRPSSDSNDNIVIKKVDVYYDNIVVNLKFRHYVSGKVKVFVSEDDICTLENASDFPKELVGNQTTFSVKLKLKEKANRSGKGSISQFTVELDKNYYEGSYNEVKKIDLSQYYDDL